MAAKYRRAMMLFLVVGLFAQLSCSQRTPRIAADLEFDATGKLVALTGPDHKKTFIHYDSRGLPVEVVSPDGSAQSGYDAGGNRIWTRDVTGTTEYYRDAFDRLSAVIWDRGPKRLIAYQYDHTGLISRISVYNLRPLENIPPYSDRVARLSNSSISSTSGWHEREQEVLALVDELRAAPVAATNPWIANDVSFLRNLGGDLEEIRSDAGRVQFRRSADGNRVERSLPNGVRSVFEYTSDRRLSNLRHVDSAGSVIASFDYRYDATGRLESLAGTELGHAATESFSWDPRGRLREMNPTSGETFQFKSDEKAQSLRVTSRGKSVTYSYDALGRISKAKGVALSVSPEGSIRARQDDRELTQIKYNQQSLPSEISTRKSRVSYVWDSERHLVSKTQNGKTIHFVPAAGTGLRVPLLEYDEGGSEVKDVFVQSVLGRIGTDAEYYLEGPLGESRYTVGGQGLLKDSSGHRAVRRREPISAADLIPASSRSEIHARRNSTKLLLAQLTAPDPGFNPWSDPGDWLLQSWVFNNWFLPVISTAAPTFDYAANLKLMQAAAMGQGPYDGIGGRALGYIGIAADVFGGGVLDDAEQWRNKYSNLPTNTWLSDSGLGLKTLWDVFGGELITAPMESALQKSYAEIISSERLPLLSARSEVTGSIELISAEAREAFDNHVAIAADAFAASFNRNVGLVAEQADHLIDSLAESYKSKLQSDDARNNALAALPSKMPSVAITDQQVGGIQLSATAVGKIGNISGAVYDPSSGAIVLLSDNSGARLSGVTAEDFAVALGLAYSESPEEAAFSLDPANPKDPMGPMLQKVYYPAGVLAGTGFGKAMFDADWLLKQYSFGVVAEPGKDQRARNSSVPGFKSVAALSLERQNGGNGPATMARFWIVSGEMRIRRDGSAIVFDKAAMGVKTKRQVRDSSSKTGLRDDNSVKDPINDEFAKRFTEHYDELAAESPELERVRDLAKAVAIAKWLRQNNVPVDPNAFRPSIAGSKREDPDAYRMVPALSTEYKQKRDESIPGGMVTHTRELSLFGGVDLESNPQFVADPGVAQIRRAVEDQLRQAHDPKINFTYQGRAWTGTDFPLTDEALQQRANAKSFVRDGVVYKLGVDGKIGELVDPVGNRASYRNPARGVEGGVEITGKDGWKALAQPQQGGTDLQIITARGDSINVMKDRSGAVQSIEVNGKTWAEYHSQGKVRSVRLNRGNYTATLICDSSGRVTEYQLERPGGAAGALMESAKIEYSSDGLPLHLKGIGIPDTQWQYDSANRLQLVTSSDGQGLAVAYDGGGGRTTSEGWTGGSGDHKADAGMEKLAFENNHLTRSESAQTGGVDYKYENQHLVSVKSELFGEMHFTYDKAGRPATVVLPSGMRLRYMFTDKGKKGKSGATGLKIQVLGSFILR